MGFLDHDRLLMAGVLPFEGLVHHLPTLFGLHQTLHRALLDGLGQDEASLALAEGDPE